MTLLLIFPAVSLEDTLLDSPFYDSEITETVSAEKSIADEVIYDEDTVYGGGEI